MLKDVNTGKQKHFQGPLPLLFVNRYWAKWLPFCRRHFQKYIRNKNLRIWIQSSLTFVFDSPMTMQSAIDQVMHCSDVIMRSMAFQITSISTVCSTVCWGAHQRKHQSSALPGYWPLWRESAGDRYVDSPHKGPVTQTMFTFDDVTMWQDPKQAMSHYTPQFSVAYTSTWEPMSAYCYLDLHKIGLKKTRNLI